MVLLWLRSWCSFYKKKYPNNHVELEASKIRNSLVVTILLLLNFKILIMNKVILLILFLTVSSLVFSQRVQNTSFRQKGNNIEITYNLRLPEYRHVDIEVFISTDGGRNFKGPLQAVSGDVGKVETGGQKTIIWNVFDEFRELKGNLSFEVRANVIRLPYDFEKETYISYNISGTSALGFTYGQVQTIGWYGRIKTNGVFAFTDYEADDNQITNYTGGGYYIFTDQVKRSRLALTGGLLYRMHPNVYLYVGGGFGYRALLWNAEEYSMTNEKMPDIWAMYQDNSATGVEAEIGMIFRIGNFNFSTGLNTVSFEFFEINAGMGFFF